MGWWIWIVLGLVLLLGELVTPGGFYILFFGVGAIIGDYAFGISQLAQTTLRSEFGKIELDRTFEERTNINTQVVSKPIRPPSPGASK
jgi:regulator of protease activity HflC (stomatin/prohibitin superfamily)